MFQPLQTNKHRRAASALFITIALVTVGQSKASAHVVYAGNVLVGATGNFCLLGYSEISHGSNGLGYSRVRSETHAADPSSVPCWFRPPNWVFEHALSAIIYYWIDEWQRWEPCWASDWGYSRDATFHHRAWNINAMCGSNTFYATVGGIAARNDSNAPFVGNYILSGSATNVAHFVPA